MAAILPCSTDQASVQAAALLGTDGCLASPRVPAGLAAACAGHTAAQQHGWPAAAAAAVSLRCGEARAWWQEPPADSQLCPQTEQV